MSLLPFNRFLGLRLVPLCIRLGISANQVTALSLLAGLTGCPLLIEGNAGSLLLGILCFVLANILDEADGAVARATRTSSGFGSWLDTGVGCVVHAGFFFSLGWGLWSYLGHPSWVWLGAATSLGVVASTVSYLVSQVWARGREALLHPDPPRGPSPDPLDAMKMNLRSDFSLIVLAAAVLGVLGWILWGAFVGTFLFWIPADLRMAARLRRPIS